MRAPIISNHQAVQANRLGDASERLEDAPDEPDVLLRVGLALL